MIDVFSAINCGKKIDSSIFKTYLAYKHDIDSSTRDANLKKEVEEEVKQVVFKFGDEKNNK